MAKTAMLPFSSSAWLVTPRTKGLLPDNMQVCKELTNEMCQKTPALRAIYLLNNWLSMGFQILQVGLSSYAYSLRCSKYGIFMYLQRT